jgi:iron(III) transport system permease protein
VLRALPYFLSPTRPVNGATIGRAVGHASFVIVMAALALLPLLAAIHGSFEAAAGGYTLDGWRHAFGDSKLIGALGNTVALTTVTQVIAMTLGIGVAWLLGRTDLPGKQWLEFAFWISFFLPSLAVIQGWTLVLDPHYGLLNKWLMTTFDLTSAPLDIYSWGGIVFGHLATTTVSAKVMMLTPAFQAMDTRLEEAALIAGDSRLRALRKVTLPVLAPAITVAALLGIVYALQSFETELVLGSPRNIDVYSTVIYNMTRSDPIDFNSAFALGNVVVVITILFALISRRTGQSDRHVTISGHARPQPLSLGRWRWPLSLAVSALALLLTLVPLTFLVTSSFMTRFGFFGLSQVWTTAHWHNVLTDSTFASALRSTLIFASGSALLAVALSTLLAYTIVRSTRWGSAVLELSSWIPSSIPGVLFSLAWLWLILRSGADWLYGSTLSLIVVMALAWITLAVQLIRSQLLQISPQLEEAAMIAGSSGAKILRSIVIPLCIRTIVVVAVMVFVSAIRDVGHIALLTSSDNQPLSILQLGLLTEGRSEPAAVIGVMLAAMAIVAALIARRLGYRMQAH